MEKKSDYARVLLIDYAETSLHLVPILKSQFKCSVYVSTSEDEVFEHINKKLNLILILDKKSGEIGPSIAKKIRLAEKENDLGEVPIVVLLSEHTFIKTKDVDYSHITNYHPVCLTRFSLSDIMKNWLLDRGNFNDESEELDKSVVETLASLRSTDCGDLLTESINTFIEQYDNQIRNIEFGWYKKDFHTIKQAAHFMKSSSITMGANKLAKLFADLEINYIHDENRFQEKIKEINLSFEIAKKLLLDFSNDATNSKSYEKRQ